MTKVAFDVDDTLIKKSDINDDIPRYDVIFLLSALQVIGCEIFVWSGGGIDYAQRWCEKLGISDSVRVIAKGSEEMDVAFDDQFVNLAKVNIQV